MLAFLNKIDKKYIVSLIAIKIKPVILFLLRDISTILKLSNVIQYGHFCLHTYSSATERRLSEAARDSADL